MGSFSLWHWLVVIILVLLLFGRGRISDMMGDIGKGLKSFKQGMADEEPPAKSDPKTIENRPIDVSAEPRPREGTAVPPRDDGSSRL
jgi:sec-independent protein translocase protein TatA